MKIRTVQAVSIRTVAAAMLGAAGFALGGCATTHVGDDWQCPVVHGVPCQSVMEADPTGPGRQQSPGGQRNELSGIAGVERSRKCDASCRPFGWLRRALAGGNTLAGGNAHAGGKKDTTEPESSAIPDSEPEELRTAEVIGRIWIAPWVDDEGVYHEASWIRVVLQPAFWKLP